MESAFQFTNPILKELDFSLNEGFEKVVNKEIPIQLSLSVQVNKSAVKNEAMVELTVEIGEKCDNVPFWIRAIEQANFRWDELVVEEMVDRLLNQNAPSLLLSYLRPIVSQVSSASKYGAYNIPFINFTDQNK